MVAEVPSTMAMVEPPVAAAIDDGVGGASGMADEGGDGIAIGGAGGGEGGDGMSAPGCGYAAG